MSFNKGYRGTWIKTKKCFCGNTFTTTNRCRKYCDIHFGMDQRELAKVKQQYQETSNA